MNKRPKSREETPKEGSDNAKALPHRNNMRPRCTKRKGFGLIIQCKIRKSRRCAKAAALGNFYSYFNCLISRSGSNTFDVRLPVRAHSRIRDCGSHRKYTDAQADSKPEKLRRRSANLRPSTMRDSQDCVR